MPTHATELIEAGHYATLDQARHAARRREFTTGTYHYIMRDHRAPAAASWLVTNRPPILGRYWDSDGVQH